VIYIGLIEIRIIKLINTTQMQRTPKDRTIDYNCCTVLTTEIVTDIIIIANWYWICAYLSNYKPKVYLNWLCVSKRLSQRKNNNDSDSKW